MDPLKAKFLPPPHFINKATRSPWLIIIHTLDQIQGFHLIAHHLPIYWQPSRRKKELEEEAMYLVAKNYV